MKRWLLAAALPLLLLGFGLTHFGLLNNVEGMYAEIAREMLSRGDVHGWVIPHLNGLPYIEKPPLLYWAIATSMALFGTHDWAVRLVPVMASLLALSVAAAWTTRLRGPRAGATTLFVLGTTGGFLLMARVALTDALLMACLTAAWLWAYLALAEQRRGWWRASLVALALALLAKGFVALALFGLVGVVHLLVNERAHWRHHLRLIADPAAWGLFLLVAAPWHIAASLELREFAWFYFINEHVLRFLGLREPKDYYHGTIFYYLPRLALMALPWWPLALLAAWRRRAKGVVEAAGDAVKPFVVSLSNHACPSTSSEPAPDLIGGRTDVQSPERFLWVCALAPLTFFSVSSAKANYYIVVCLPPLALLAAWQIDAWRRHPHRGRDAFIAACGLALVPGLLALLHYGAATEGQFCARPMAAAIAAQPEKLPVFLYQDYEDYSGLPFYLQSDRIGIVDQQSADLRFGLSLPHDATRYPSRAEFLARREPAWLVILDARVRSGLPADLAPRLERVARVGNATLYRLTADPAPTLLAR